MTERIKEKESGRTHHTLYLADEYYFDFAKWCKTNYLSISGEINKLLKHRLKEIKEEKKNV